MNRLHLIKSGFYSIEDYTLLLEKEKFRIVANDEGTCWAEFKVYKGYFTYNLVWLKDGKFLGDDITLFEPTQENINKFNYGCAIMAERLELYIDINNPLKVPDSPPAFGDLTFQR